MDAAINTPQDWALLTFLDFEKGLNGESRSALHQKRKQAFARYTETGFPMHTDEEWRYTNPAPIRDGRFALLRAPNEIDAATVKSAERLFTPGLSSVKILVVDGKIQMADNTAANGLSLETIKGGADAAALGTVASSEEAFVALNTAFMQDALVVRVEKNVRLEAPLEVLWVVTSNARKTTTAPRLFVDVAAGAQCTIVERFSSLEGEAYFTNAVAEFVVGENAHVEHFRVQDEALSAFHVSTIQAQVARSGVMRTHTFSFGGKLVRNNVNIAMNGTGCNVTMNGLSALTAEQHVDNHTLLDHAMPHCESHELYKGVYGDSAQGVFSGTIIVREDAQKTNAIQSNRSLLLTDKAGINTKPQLKIWADDVKCTHGATIGQLDDDALFYIKSRGVTNADARLMLIHAFASEVISEVPVEPLRENLEAMLLEKLKLG